MFEPLTAQQGAGAALMTAALGLLVLAWLSLRTTPRGFAVAGALFLFVAGGRSRSHP
jgi:hypothetical protein